MFSIQLTPEILSFLIDRGFDIHAYHWERSGSTPPWTHLLNREELLPVLEKAKINFNQERMEFKESGIVTTGRFIDKIINSISARVISYLNIHQIIKLADFHERQVKLISGDSVYSQQSRRGFSWQAALPISAGNRLNLETQHILYNIQHGRVGYAEFGSSFDPDLQSVINGFCKVNFGENEIQQHAIDRHKKSYYRKGDVCVEVLVKTVSSVNDDFDEDEEESENYITMITFCNWGDIVNNRDIKTKTFYVPGELVDLIIVNKDSIIFQTHIETENEGSFSYTFQLVYFNLLEKKISSLADASSNRGYRSHDNTTHAFSCFALNNQFLVWNRFESILMLIPYSGEIQKFNLPINSKYVKPCWCSSERYTICALGNHIIVYENPLNDISKIKIFTLFISNPWNAVNINIQEEYNHCDSTIEIKEVIISENKLVCLASKSLDALDGILELLFHWDIPSQQIRSLTLSPFSNQRQYFYLKENNKIISLVFKVGKKVYLNEFDSSLKLKGALIGEIKSLWKVCCDDQFIGFLPGEDNLILLYERKTLQHVATLQTNSWLSTDTPRIEKGRLYSENQCWDFWSGIRSNSEIPFIPIPSKASEDGELINE